MSQPAILFYICRAAAIGSASEITSKGAWLATACTVLGQESVIQKCLKSVAPFPFDEEDAVKRFQESLGKTPWVTYALTANAPCNQSKPVAAKIIKCHQGHFPSLETWYVCCPCERRCISLHFTLHIHNWDVWWWRQLKTMIALTWQLLPTMARQTQVRPGKNSDTCTLCTWLDNSFWHSLRVPPDCTRSSTMTTCRPLGSPSFSLTMRLSPSLTLVQITCTRHGMPSIALSTHNNLSWHGLHCIFDSQQFIMVCHSLHSLLTTIYHGTAFFALSTYNSIST